MKRGFTLIELLIVIAIIAILALIAVPNFLEAQVRAKVSRVHADMRSLATAIETYAVDWGRAPLDGLELQKRGVSPSTEIAVYSRITTPVGYITTIPFDPFVERGGMDKKGFDPTRNLYQYTTPWPYDTWDRLGRALCREAGIQWIMHSPGPSRDERRPDDPTMRMQANSILTGIQGLWTYDSSNGTISIGFIIRTNHGVFQGQGWKAR